MLNSTSSTYNNCKNDLSTGRVCNNIDPETGEPTTKNCMVAKYTGSTYFWVPVTCPQRRQFVCEYICPDTPVVNNDNYIAFGAHKYISVYKYVESTEKYLNVSRFEGAFGAYPTMIAYNYEQGLIEAAGDYSWFGVKDHGFYGIDGAYFEFTI